MFFYYILLFSVFFQISGLKCLKKVQGGQKGEQKMEKVIYDVGYPHHGNFNWNPRDSR